AEIARDLPGARVNLMAQYRPNANVRGTALDRRPAADELERAIGAARSLGLDLAPRGQLASVGFLTGRKPAAGSPSREAGPPFESSIHLDPDGTVTIENLSSELASLARELGSLPDPTRPS
ncbi:hypothetical protein HY251_15485, partial [bacterium]|nr:hypothetical protein [bacterium]